MQIHKNKIILLFTPGPLGGAEKVVLGGFLALKRLNLDVELWVIKETRAPLAFDQFTERLKETKTEFRFFSCRSIIDLKLRRDLTKALRDAGPALIHSHGFKASFYGFSSKNRGSKFILTHHGKTGHTLKGKLYEWIEESIMKRADKVIAVSGVMKNELEKTKIKSILVENFLSLDENILQEDKGSGINLLFAGRLSPEKGCSVLIKALKEFHSENLSITVAGDGIEREALEKEAKELNVKFLGFQKNILGLMAQHDALIIPSFREGQPLILIEALSLGLPVIASRVGGMPELIENEKNGILFPPGDFKELARILNGIEVQLPLLKWEARKRSISYRKRFSVETHALNLKRIYESVLNQ